ncbi:response regulator transcription factor [Aureibacter tunicatorum]|uniref:DNA-binding CsgD family transcriptional regulator n=1 Tax=Aureibacter tunicatorum TaxID=866807 RepID=A0AAE3XNS7_9BACT|nr:LuxR C-terminal-related transcriptional regulator [Aureibacter tunicatorum]MDR6239900.1 DNA-binding CsgD family transcriptional regulator [Aureibacter tunicatorum]BDD04375.1 helix-turn-helix transcriptional regulator [Aureibacter tunicatorum]
MDPISRLENEYSKETYDSLRQRTLVLEECIAQMKSYVEIEHCVVVMSDLAEKNNHIFNGSFGDFLGLNPSRYRVIDGIWEREIYEKIHPDDVFQRHLLELEFYNFLQSLPKTERLSYRTNCKLRAMGKDKMYQVISHKSFYLRMSENGSLWLDACVYNFSTSNQPFQGIEGRIINMKTGEFIDVDKFRNSTNMLSSREKEVLRLVGKGSLSKEISSELNISVNTVNRHRQNILQKLKVNNSMEAVKVAIAMNLM